MTDMVTVVREDLERTLERVDRARQVGKTPGEKLAEDRLRAALAGEQVQKQESEPAPEPTLESQGEPKTLRDVLPDVADELEEVGFATLEDVQMATDEELLAIDGIGPVTLHKIREAVS